MTQRNKPKPNMRELARLASEGVPIAIDTLIGIAGDEGARASDRVAASKALLIAAGSTQDAAGKPMEDMTPAELAAYRQHLEAKLAQMDAERGNDVFG